MWLRLRGNIVAEIEQLASNRSKQSLNSDHAEQLLARIELREVGGQYST